MIGTTIVVVQRVWGSTCFGFVFQHAEQLIVQNSQILGVIGGALSNTSVDEWYFHFIEWTTLYCFLFCLISEKENKSGWKCSDYSSYLNLEGVPKTLFYWAICTMFGFELVERFVADYAGAAPRWIYHSQTPWSGATVPTIFTWPERCCNLLSFEHIAISIECWGIVSFWLFGCEATFGRKQNLGYQHRVGGWPCYSKWCNQSFKLVRTKALLKMCSAAGIRILVFLQGTDQLSANNLCTDKCVQVSRTHSTSTFDKIGHAWQTCVALLTLSRGSWSCALGMWNSFPDSTTSVYYCDARHYSTSLRITSTTELEMHGSEWGVGLLHAEPFGIRNQHTNMTLCLTLFRPIFTRGRGEGMGCTLR